MGWTQRQPFVKSEQIIAAVNYFDSNMVNMLKYAKTWKNGVDDGGLSRKNHCDVVIFTLKTHCEVIARVSHRLWRFYHG